MKSNCLLYAVKYRLTNRKSKLKACWDDELNFYHFFIIHDDYEIHCEQKIKMINGHFYLNIK